MEITDLRIIPIKNEKFLRAYVSATFDNELVVHNIRIVELENRLVLSMPNKKTKDGEYKDYVHPISPAFRKKITDRILSEYEAVVGEEN